MREWLKTCRSEKGMTMKEMGANLGISESYYCAIENGERQKKMDIVLVAALSSVLDISVAEIARYESEWATSLNSLIERKAMEASAQEV